MSFKVCLLKKSDKDFDEKWKATMKIKATAFEHIDKNNFGKWLETKGPKYFEEELRSFGNYKWLLILNDRTVKGFAQITEEQLEGNMKKGYVDYIATDDSERGTGIGKQLIQYIQSKYDVITLSSLPNVLGFYKKCGFHKKSLEGQNNLSLESLHRSRDDTDVANHIKLEKVKLKNKSKEV